MDVLWSHASFVAINKPPNLSVHESPGPGSSVLRELAAQGFENLTPVHRLDKDASGVLLLAKTKFAAAEIQKRWSTVRKTYLAVCAGTPELTQRVIDAPILENQTGKPERLRNALRYFSEKNPDVELPPVPAPKTSGIHPAGRAAQTEYRVIERFEKYSLLEVSPRQGRMHQIRVHLAHQSHPILNDRLYGANESPPLIDRLALHASRLQFEWEGAQIVIDAPLPMDIENLLLRLRASRAPQ